MDDISPVVEGAFDVNKTLKMTRYIGTKYRALPFSSTIKTAVEMRVPDLPTSLGLASDALRMAGAMPDNPVSIASDAAWGASMASEWAKGHQPHTAEEYRQAGAAGKIGFSDSAANGINATREGAESLYVAAKPAVQAAYDKLKMADPNSPASDASGTWGALRHFGQAVVTNLSDVEDILSGRSPRAAPDTAPAVAPAARDAMQGYAGSRYRGLREMKNDAVIDAHPAPVALMPTPDPVPDKIGQGYKRPPQRFGMHL